MDLIIIFFKAFSTIFFAEMGDKTQLLVIAFTSKYKIKDILLGVSISVLVLNGCAVIAGNIISKYVDIGLIKIFAALLFLIFAMFSLMEDNDLEKAPRQFKLPPVMAIAGTFFIAELGDKTQIATMSNAATYDGGSLLIALTLIFIGSVIAMIASNSLAIFAIYKLGKHIPAHVFKNISFFIFGIFGMLTLYEGLTMYGAKYSYVIALMTLVICAFLAVSYLILKITKGSKLNERKRCKIKN